MNDEKSSLGQRTEEFLKEASKAPTDVSKSIIVAAIIISLGIIIAFVPLYMGFSEAKSAIQEFPLEYPLLLAVFIVFFLRQAPDS
jgi:hypothetical protein